MSEIFKFKYFEVQQKVNTMKVGTDSMLLGSCLNHNCCKNALDIGAGTGVLSLMLAQINKNTKIYSIELDEKSAIECKQNFENSSFKERLFCIYGDFLKYKFNEKFDFIFSNPPFFENSLLSIDTCKNRVRHNDYLPLNQMINKVNNILNDNGVFQCIIPCEILDNWLFEFKLVGMNLTEKIYIYSKNNNLKRYILTFSKLKDSNLVEKEIIIRDSNNLYSEQYKKLTKDFHYVEL